MTFTHILQRRAKKSQEGKVISKFSPYDIIVAPLMTEKTYKLQEVGNKYSFKIHKDANKNDVKAAIAYIYGVTPIDIHMIIVRSKWRNQRKLVRREYKKAIVTLNKEDKIELS